MSGIRSKLKSPIYLLVLFLLVLNVIWIAASYLKSDTLRKGTAAPDFTLERMDRPGETVSLSGFRVEKNVILLFWNSMCSACRKELLSLVGVNLDVSGDARARLFLKENEIGFTNLHDEGMTARLYGVGTLPTLYIVDREGKICYGATGYTSVDKLVSVNRECAGL
jgi:peroxiredoxin